jgi:DNA-binding NarL/FixJ family response regulator
METYRLALVDDHRLFREGLRALLQAEPGFEVVAEASNAEEIYQAVADTSPDVVVMDLVMPGVSGILIAKELLRKDPRQRMLGLSMLREEKYVAQALDAGMMGFACKDQSMVEVAGAIRQVGRRLQYMAPFVSRPLVEDLRRQSRNGNGNGNGGSAAESLDPLGSLTHREREIFDLTVSGLSTAHIAGKLSISKRTVETHRARILRKLNAHSATDLVRMAARLGLLPP